MYIREFSQQEKNVKSQVAVALFDRIISKTAAGSVHNKKGDCEFITQP